MKHLRSGQSIVEVVIAATLISIGIIAALSLANYSTKQNLYSKSLSVATTYNSQVADWLRSEKTKSGWATLADKLASEAGSGTVTYCLTALPPLGFTSLIPGSCDETDVIVGTAFIRELSLSSSELALGKIVAVVETSWEEKTTKTATLTLELSKWQ